MKKEKQQYVTCEAKTSLSDLWKLEDYWAIWLGFILLIISMFIYFPLKPEGTDEKIAKANAILQTESDKAPFKTIEWYKAVDLKKSLKATSSPIGQKIKEFTNKPHGWNLNPLDAFFMTESKTNA